MLAVAPFFAGQTQRNTLFLNGNIMQLHYKTDHTSCLNYKTESFGGFTLGKMSEGKRFNNQKEPVKVNHLIFILEGEVSIVKDNECAISVRAGEFVFIPISSLYVGTVIRPGRYLDLTFFHNNISLCDKYMLSHYLESVGDFDPSFKALPVREPLDLFLKLLEIYLSSGINCKHLHEIKEKELFIIFRTAYTKTEMVRLLHPIMGQRVDFKGAVLQHKDRVSSREELARILRDYGEEPYAWQIAGKIVETRETAPILTTLQLADIVASAMPPAERRKNKNPSRRTFQALRIAVNHELDALEEGLDTIFDHLAPGGRLCVITFHSLEDRLVKNKFRRWSTACTCPPEFPVCVCGGKAKAKLITRKPIEADTQELEENRRSRSAHLRVLEKC